MRSNKAEVLIVEDDLIISRLHKHVIGKLVPEDPKIFLNGREALDYLDEGSGKEKEILVLLDLNMPVMNGWDFLKNCGLRPYSNKIHVVIITSSMFNEDSRKAAQFEQVIGYYVKPLKQEHLLEIMELEQVAHLFEKR
ncbi:response regulator [Salinimicrobium flavum]|uniref:Response regulator n=1 Tax=Salinimicrobium flavum TaxID=1737065 RepID=A0ABW5IZ77_9FLAO